jgi:peptide-methionine (R)-S-oxide reductase
MEDDMSDKAIKTDQQWREELTPHQYNILRQKGTEPPFSGKYVHTKDSGTYVCAACGLELFSSDTKYDSKSGWPSFWDIKNSQNIKLTKDESAGMDRIEVTCARCGSHLGHLFDDGPTDKTGQRYCINSASLNLIKKEQNER